MTAEQIKEITAAIPEEHEILLGEIQAICEAAENDSFWRICHAYALGFMRGATTAKEGDA